MNDRRKAQERALELLRSGSFGGGRVPAKGGIGDAIPIESPKGRLHSWWAPLVDNGRLEGYVTLLPDLTLLGFSRLGGNVDAAAWLDVGRIRARAESSARKGEKVGDAYLSFDGAPSRIAWAIELVGKDGRATRTVFVAGDAVWDQGLPDDEIGGGPRPPRNR